MLSVIHLMLLIIQLIICVESKVCSSLDLRNSPDQISEFRDCRVIQGHLQLLLMEPFDDDSDYFNKSFSELYEITDYLIVFRVMGLSSLNTIFPKLASIKGENLFLGYALVLYELDDLKEIGITSLRTIGRGKLKINSCPNLCYVDTVNWNAIGISHMTYDDKVANCSHEWCPQHCGGYCWNSYECQHMGKSQCDQSCIGCKVSSSKDCSLCKYFNDTGTCVQTCPKSKLIDNYSSKCITSEDCVSKKGTWSIFRNKCVHSCPLWHERNSTGQCTPSKVKTCRGIRISNSLDLQKLLGCTHIIGSLDIALVEYINTETLENILGSVVSISENLKVLRSTGITTLEFFKSLSVIKGEKLFGIFYSLFVVENQNLQKLFDDNTTLTLEKGEAFFQNNPYLCPSEYKKLKAVVTAYSNSEETVCNFRSMNVTIVTNNPTNVTIKWPKLKSKKILGYTVYYVKIAHANFSLLQVKDGFVDKDGGPSGEGWSSIFVRNNTVLLKRLTPYSKYSYYIKYNGILEIESVQTPTYSFKTGIGDPSEPVDLELASQTDTTITVKWKPPRYINGNLSHYKLAVYKLEDDSVLIKQRNYCWHPHKENNCSCPQPVDIQLFHNEAICIGKGDNYCNRQTKYVTGVPKIEPKQKLGIQKRSLNYSESLQEYIINVTRNSNQMYVVSSLKHFALYAFFLQACNDKEDSEDYHCGGSEMASLRTLKRKGADIVTNMTITVVNTSVIVSWIKPREPNSILLAYKMEYKKQDSKSLLRQKCLTSDQFDSRKSEIRINDLDQGTYQLRVKVVSLAASGELDKWHVFRIGTVNKKGGNGLNWLYGFLILLGSVAVVFLGFVIWRRYRATRNADDHTLVYRMWSERDLEEDEWKLDEETVEIIKELGQNSLGIIYRKHQIDN